jgi:hypothetical protein
MTSRRRAAAFPFVDQPGEIVEARAGAAFALDALLTSDANGKLITCTTTNPVIAHALQAATAADQLVPVRSPSAAFSHRKRRIAGPHLTHSLDSQPFREDINDPVNSPRIA